MSDMIMKGIEAAKKDLAVEKERMLQEEVATNSYTNRCTNTHLC